MKKYSLSILIPSRNEEFLKNTVEDILKNKRGDTEVIVGLDGCWSDPPIKQHPDVNVIRVPKSIGQRAITKLCGRLSRAKWIMKCDAHCSFDEGFDVKMMEFMKRVGDNVTSVPIMRNLWAFDWVCECGERKYQDKGEICDKCGKRMKKDIKWIAKERPRSASYCFDSEPHFQYFNKYLRREETKKMLKEKGYTETMSLQGSCFMMTRGKYFGLNIDDEKMGSWGNQGLETAAKTWLSGRRVLVNHNTWYAHLFRTKAQNGFGFPYPQSGSEVQKCKRKVWETIKNKKLANQIHPVSWLVERFMPVPGWDEKALKELKEYESKLD